MRDKTMLGKKENNAATSNTSQTLNTIIGRGTVFEGVMRVENSVRIDGTFKGELVCSGMLTISQSGEVYAQLEGKEVYLNGVVRGRIQAEKVRLDSQARFVGDITTSALAITEGAVFHGKCSMETGELAALYEKEFRQEGTPRSSEPIKVSSASR
ncbi:MAG: polymer-forming cytoskeletal protein [Candidatus Latescibacteria bacterium]|nr:polymer-forming cytoskeletal protein [Candidatus Latescibacterota bacterium]